MKGKVLDFNGNDRTGVISGDDGNRYSFAIDQWKSAALPAVGTQVDFTANNGAAEAISPVQAAAPAGGSSKKVPAAILAFFLGAFGAHKFYLGYTTQGVIMLLVWLFGLILLGIPSLIIGVIAFIEFIIYLTKSDADFEQIYVVGRRPWF